MRKRNGFTLIELLAVIIVLSLLLVLAVPSYTSIYTTIKRQNYQSKISEINTAAQAYGSSIKDEVKDSVGNCKTITIADLIKEGLLISEDDRKEVIYDPTTSQPMEGLIEICYCKSTFDIQSFYAEDFVTGNVYHKGDYVRYNSKTYKCLMDTSLAKNKVAGITDKDAKGNNYFEQVAC